jgi:RNA polymerase sigma factor (TIGR02999 family)
LAACPQGENQVENLERGSGGARPPYNHLIAVETLNATALLQAWGRGDRTAFDQLLPLVHAELRRVAQRQMDDERQGHTLQATALVHEVYLRLIDIKRVSWQDRSHFFAMAARLMRRVLVDHARARRSQKRGAGARWTSLDAVPVMDAGPNVDILALDAALDALARQDPRKGQVVEMRYFAGLTIEETAASLDVSVDTVMRDWRLAKAWLHRALVEGVENAGA